VILQPARREKKCKACPARFVPTRPLQVACCPDCAQTLARRNREKAEKRAATIERQKTRAALEALKTAPQLMAEADRAFCAYIRARDKAAGHPCISSGLPLDWSGNNVDAGHYRSRGAASHLRYNELNCHAQAKRENRYKGGNVVEYRAHLIQRIGLEAVEALEQDNRTHKWTRDELREIRDTYRQKLRELLKARRS